MKTLQARLLISTAIGTTLVLLVSGTVLYVLVRQSLWTEFDESLASKARSLAALVEQENDRLEVEFDEASLPEFEPSDHAEYYQLWLSRARVLARSRSLGRHDLGLIQGPPNDPAYQSVRLPDGRTGRIVGIAFVPRLEDEDNQADEPLEVTLVVGRETAGIESALARLELLLFAVCLLAVLVSLGVLAWFVRRGLRPVGWLSAQIADLGENDLSARINGAGVPTELRPVVDGLNDLLGRLGAAFQRERRFTADVAHELRTPLAGVRSMLEVALSKKRNAEAYQGVMSDCLAVNQQMQQMVENLLNLARVDAGQLEIERETVDLPELIRQCWKPLAERANQRELDVDWHLGDGCTVETDRAKLRLVLLNVLDNAITHASGEGDIVITSSPDDGAVKLVVSNTGGNVAPEDVQHVFDRFWRGDTSRQASAGHCGLGLSLCKTMVDQLGGSIGAATTADGTFTITIHLPSGNADAERAKGKRDRPE